MFHILYIQCVNHVSGNMWILAKEEGVPPAMNVHLSVRGEQSSSAAFSANPLPTP